MHKYRVVDKDFAFTAQDRQAALFQIFRACGATIIFAHIWKERFHIAF